MLNISQLIEQFEWLIRTSISVIGFILSYAIMLGKDTSVQHISVIPNNQYSNRISLNYSNASFSANCFQNIPGQVT